MLIKNFIRRNSLNYAIFVFVIKKFDKNFRICVNYKILNVLIIKNRNYFLLIKFFLIDCAQQNFTLN